MHLWIAEPWFDNQGGPGDLFSDVKDVSGNDHILVSAPGILVSNQFQHVAVTYDKASGAGVLYVNGNVAFSANLGNFTPQTSYDLSLGRRQTHDPPGVFNGMMDEVSVYGRALSASEIQAIYVAGAAGKCADPAPTAANISAVTLENVPTSIPVSKFLLAASDPDNDPLSLASVSSRSTNGGSVVLASGGVIYNPVTNFLLGADRFTYTVSDGRGGVGSAFVLMQVVSPNQASDNFLPLVPIPGGYRVSFAGMQGLTYSLQRATNVTGPWFYLGPVLAGPGGIGVYADTNAPVPSAFYRTIYP
jgi:hypothetical protein